MSRDSEQDFLLEEADRNVRAARIIADQDFPDIAVNRAYYAMFKAACAILDSIGLNPKTHAGVRTLLGQHLMRTGQLSAEHFAAYVTAMELRQETDYSGKRVSLEEAAVQIAAATAFIAEIRRLLSCQPPAPPQP